MWYLPCDGTLPTLVTIAEHSPGLQFMTKTRIVYFAPFYYPEYFIQSWLRYLRQDGGLVVEINFSTQVEAENWLKNKYQNRKEKSKVVWEMEFS